MIHKSFLSSFSKQLCLGEGPNIVGAHEKVHTISKHFLEGLIDFWRLSLNLQKLNDVFTLHIDARKHRVKELREVFCIAPLIKLGQHLKILIEERLYNVILIVTVECFHLSFPDYGRIGTIWVDYFVPDTAFYFYVGETGYAACPADLCHVGSVFA